MMPPIRHRTVEQQVAKPAAAPEVLPSGQRVWTGTSRRPTIPAPPAGLSAAPAAASPIQPQNLQTAPTVDRLAQQKETDVAALLMRDPRARSLTFTLRGQEVRLAGTVAKTEDLFALADLIDALPGVDFVSFDDVEFQNP
jgi:hypothetical protein